MNTIVRSRTHADALDLSDDVQAGLVTETGEPRSERTRSVAGWAATILGYLPEAVAGERVREETLQVVGLVDVLRSGRLDREGVVSLGYAPDVVEAAAAVATGLAGMTQVQEATALVATGDVRAIVARLAAAAHDIDPDLVMRLPAADRGVIGINHKVRKALTTGLDALAGLEPGGLGLAGVGSRPEEREADADSPRIGAVRDEVAERLDGLPTRDLALALLDYVAETSRGRDISLEEAIRAMGRSEPDGEIMAALAFLTQGDKAALDASVVFLDERGVGYPVDHEERRLAVANGYRHPVTGEAVPNPETRFFLRFTPRAGLLAGHRRKPVAKPAAPQATGV